jgi:hypothetical protein
MLLGGFHAEGIKEFLKSKGVSFDVIIPNVDAYKGKNLH